MRDGGWAWGRGSVGERAWSGVGLFLASDGFQRPGIFLWATRTQTHDDLQ